eukprot:gene5114-32762_t
MARPCLAREGSGCSRAECEAHCNSNPRRVVGGAAARAAGGAAGGGIAQSNKCAEE